MIRQNSRIPKPILFLVSMIVLSFSAPDAMAQTAETSALPSGKLSLPRSFHGIELGMAVDEVEALLKNDPLFSYEGPEDVSLLPSPNMSLIDTQGLSFVRRAFFQFQEGRLWVMILVLSPDKIDHYSIFSTLSAKYGPPSLLDPRESRWEDDLTRVALERPLTLRYLDLEAYGKLREGSSARESLEELERRDFLGGL